MKRQNVYIGNISKKGIFNYELIQGKLILKNVTNDFERCTYLAQNKTHIYGVIEKDEGRVVTYKKNQGQLKYINQIFSYGKGPCHIEINEKNTLIFISNYTNGNLTILKMNNDNTIGNVIFSKANNIKNSHMHCVKTTRDNQYFFSVDLGEDLLTMYKINEDNIKEIDNIKFKKGTQPRHIVIGDDKIYLITERSCELYVIKFNNQKLQITNVISLLPKEVEREENYTGCAIKITNDFRNIYTTIRGHNSISVYEINKNDIKMIQNISCQGDLPRDLEIDTEENYVLVANQESNEIAIFKRNKYNGKLQFTYKENVVAPTCVIVE